MIKVVVRHSVFVLVVFSSLVSARAARAQTARVEGTVADVTGGALPGTVVELRSTSTPGVLRTVTDTEGVFAFQAVAPGAYHLEASLAGFRTHTSDVDARAGETHTVEVVLELSAVVESVSVTRTVQSEASVPHAVSVIEGDAVQAFQRRASPAEAFIGTPGMYVENRRNYSLSGGIRFAIRQPLPRFGMRGVQILQDGVPMTMADGTTEPTNIDLASLGRIEVLRGPSSVLYGNSAGGVITLQSEFPTDTRLLVQPDLQWGSYGYAQQGMKVSGSSGRTSYVVSANRLHSDGFRQHSAADVHRGNVVVLTALSARTDVRVVYNIYDLPFGQSASTITLADARTNPTFARPQAFTQGWGESTRQHQGGVTLRHAFGNAGTLTVTGWGTRRRVWNPIPAAVVDLKRGAGGLRSEYSSTLRIGAVPTTWTTGFDLSLQSDRRQEFDNAGVPTGGDRTRIGALHLAQQEKVRSASPFVLVSSRLANRWHLSAGARYDRYRFTAVDQYLSNGDQSGGRTMSAISPMAGLTYLPSAWLNLYANIATAYQTPTTVELSNRPDGQGGFNQDLGPEKLRSVEVGARGAVAPLRGRFEVATYASRVDNALVRFTRADEQAYFRNAGRTTRRGLEALFEWMPTSRLRGRVAYTYQHFVLDRFVAPEGDFSGKPEPGAPPHQLIVGGTYSAAAGLFGSLQYRFIDAYPVNSANTIANWSYRVVDVRLGLDRRLRRVRLRPFVSIDNLFDERYNSSAIVNSLGDRYFEPSPGREIAVGVTIGANLF
ncbi:MAG: TonB-dependent receptor [Vicinamibacterales bacterium]